MTQSSLDSALVSSVTPSGRIDVRPGAPEDAPRMSAAAARRIREAFAAGRGHGVLYLGAGELGTELSPALSYWRDVGQAFVAKACGVLDRQASSRSSRPSSRRDPVQPCGLSDSRSGFFDLVRNSSGRCVPGRRSTFGSQFAHGSRY